MTLRSINHHQNWFLKISFDGAFFWSLKNQTYLSQKRQPTTNISFQSATKKMKLEKITRHFALRSIQAECKS